MDGHPVFLRLDRIKEVLGKRQIILDRCRNDVFQRAQLCRCPHAFDKWIERDHDAGTGIIKLMFQFPRHVKRVRHHRNAAHHQGSVISNHCLRAIWQHDGYPVALANAQLPQGIRKPVRLFQQNTVRHFLSHEFQSRYFGIPIGGKFQEMREILLWIIIGGRYFSGIKLQPRFPCHTPASQPRKFYKTYFSASITLAAICRFNDSVFIAERFVNFLRMDSWVRNRSPCSM
ncbi:hypothetical protein D3C74_272230 [compost metagenome]